jgi:hypothetical protein
VAPGTLGDIEARRRTGSFTTLAKALDVSLDDLAA